MIVHKFKLSFFRNIYNLLFYINTVVLIAIFIIVLVGLMTVNDQAKKNEGISKSLYCILSIKPEIRTEKNIGECIQKNTGQRTINSEYFFQSIEVKDDIGETLPTETLINLLKGEKGDRGEKGESITGASGQNGTNGQDGKNGADGNTVVGPQGEQGPAGREVEFRHNSTKKRIEWRYVGDTLWQVLTQDCQLTSSCT